MFNALYKYYVKLRLIWAVRGSNLKLAGIEHTNTPTDTVVRIKPDDGYKHQGDTCSCGPIWAHHKHAKTPYWSVTHRWMNTANVS